MGNKGVITKILAVAGTVLVWFPVVAPVLLWLRSLTRGHSLFDYLIPAELFPLTLVGGLLLLWTALRARAYRKLIAWSLGGAVVLLVGSQLLAVVTGLASGETEPSGWIFALVVGALILYTLAVIAMGVAGILLLRHLYKPAQSLTAS